VTWCVWSQSRIAFWRREAGCSVSYHNKNHGPAASNSDPSCGNLHYPLLTLMMTRAQTLHTTLWLVCLSYMIRLASAQDDPEFPSLPTTPFIDRPSAGNFTWPSGSTGIFDQGTPMSITWESPYTQVNLYLIWNQTVGEGIGSQRQIGSRDISPTFMSTCTDGTYQLESPANQQNGLLIAISEEPIPAPKSRPLY
jgi:hypothetical protein